MKKLLISLSILGLGFTAIADNDLHSNLARTKGSYYVSMSHSDVDARVFNKAINPSLDFFEGNLEEVRYLSLSQNMLSGQSMVISSFVKDSMEMVEVSGKSDLLVFARKADGKITEVHFIIPTDDGSDTNFTLLSLYGNMRMKV